MAARRFASIEDFENWCDDVAADRFSREKVTAAGNCTALYDAIQQILEDGDEAETLPVPRWVLEAVLDRALPQVPQQSRQGRRGRPAARWNAAQWRRDAIDWHRFCQVWYGRIARRDRSPEHPTPRKQRERRHEYQRSQAAHGSRYVVDTSTPYPWTGGKEAEDWSVFEAASKIFEGGCYQGQPTEIKKSYERVTAALKRREAWRYYPSKWLRYDKGQILNAEMDQAR
jgi:hypothetical protein